MPGSTNHPDVIIIDRNATVRRMMRSMLESAGFEVLEAAAIDEIDEKSLPQVAPDVVVFLDVSRDATLAVDFSQRLPARLRLPKRTVLTTVKPALVESLCPPNRPRAFARILGRPFRPAKVAELFDELFPGRRLEAPEVTTAKTPDWARLGRRLAEPDGMIPPSGEHEVVEAKTVAADSVSRPTGRPALPRPRHAATVITPDGTFPPEEAFPSDDAAFEIETRAGIVDPLLHLAIDPDDFPDPFSEPSKEIDLRSIVRRHSEPLEAEQVLDEDELDLEPIDIELGDSDDQPIYIDDSDDLLPAMDMATADLAVAVEAAERIVEEMQIADGHNISDVFDVTTEKSAAEIARLLALAEKQLAEAQPPLPPTLAPPPPPGGVETSISPLTDGGDADAIITADEHALGTDLLDAELDGIELEELPAEFVQPIEDYSDEFAQEVSAGDAFESVPPPAPSLPAHVIQELSAQGSLRVWPLGEILSHVANRGYQGSIEIGDDDRGIVIMFNGAFIAWAEPNGAAAPRSTIDFMLRTQLVTPETAAALEKMGGAQREIPEMLVAQGYATQEEVYATLAWQVGQFVWEALSLVDAHFELNVGLDQAHAVLIEQRPLLQIDAKSTLFQFYRAYPDALPVRVNNPGERFVTRAEIVPFHGLGPLLPEEAWALDLLAEPRTLDGMLELAADNGFDPDVMLSVLARLCEIGLVTALRRWVFGS